jgi:G6PDH family F420-dependent oxidoreductase
VARYGFSLMCEIHHPDALLAQARRAEEVGFDFITISDHIHPWLESHEHSAYAWSLLGALAVTTRRAELVSLVTCPTVRYHPAIVAQKAATVAAMSGGRLRLGLGSGENLNEHVVGRGWPPADVRREMLEEAVEIIRALLDGGYVSHRGPHFRVQDARIFTLPETPPPIYVAAGGPQAAELAGRVGDGLVATEPDAGLVRRFDAGGAGRPHMGQMAVSAGDDEEAALADAHRFFRFSAPGWKVMSELPNVANFEAATRSVRPEDLAGTIPCGPDEGRVVEAATRWTGAGFDHLAFAPVGDIDAFFAMWEAGLRDRLP